MKTFYLRNEDVVRRWYVVDATDVILGKLAVKAARLLMGKEDPIYTPWVDSGHFIVVTNAEKVKVTGKKESGKVYRRYTGHPGGLVETTLSEMRAGKPAKVIELAVRRMLPKNKLGRRMFKRLRVYAGAEHKHSAQKPEPLKIG
ncbi:MAG: 50S ribosomal protein L13 [Planctomycetota bacterium]|nr:50S ribosomal protein L13 [Planctomycetota bacterium]